MIKLDDATLNDALMVAKGALLSDDADNLSQQQKSAFVTIAAALVLDIRRIADAIEKLASKEG